MEERIQKILSQWGVASRRQAEQLILNGQVMVNGQVATLGQKANPDCDCITVDGKEIKQESRPQFIYLLINKPFGMVCTCEDPQGRPKVLDLLPEELRKGQGIHPVGRLDIESTGALILTNDGELTFQLTHPSHELGKTYQVLVKGHPSLETLNKWREGVILSGKPTLPAQVKVIDAQASDQTLRQTLLEIVISEGRNRQIRRVAELLGHPVIKLHRIAIGPVSLNGMNQDQLAPGHYRQMEQQEIDSLKNLVTSTTTKTHLQSVRRHIAPVLQTKERRV
jgi:pseudouridine synthase